MPAVWPDGVIFHQFAYFWKAIEIFWSDEVAQRHGNILDYFLFKDLKKYSRLDNQFQSTRFL